MKQERCIYALVVESPGYTGLIKIGQTKRELEERKKDLTRTMNIRSRIEFIGIPVFDIDEEKNKEAYEKCKTMSFEDTEFHRFLRKEGYYQLTNADSGNLVEFFRISISEVKECFKKMKRNGPVEFGIRDEQKDCINMLAKNYSVGLTDKMLVNSKPRSGKTFSLVEAIKKLKDVENILVVTNRPGDTIMAWRKEVADTAKTFCFVSHYHNDTTYSKYKAHIIKDKNLFYFLSMQRLKKSKYFGGDKDTIREVSEIPWDILIIDEAHEGVDTEKTQEALKKIKRKFTVYLTGTACRMVENGMFREYEIFNYTYIDEQKKKEYYAKLGVYSPYEDFPTMNMHSFLLNHLFNIPINKENLYEDYSFADSPENLFCRTNNRFVYDKEVDYFLDKLITDPKYLFANGGLNHSLMLVDRVETAKLLEKKICNNPNYKGIKVINIAGDEDKYAEKEEKYGNDDDRIIRSAELKVKKAIEKYERTITISVNRLTQGVTIPKWNAVVMLSNTKSDIRYIQTMFRVQSDLPGKRNAHVIDFLPQRTLEIYEHFANDMVTKELSDVKRRENVEEMLKYFPVFGEDEDGNVIPYTVDDIRVRPNKIKKYEVVRRGFCSDTILNTENIGCKLYKIMDDDGVLKTLDKPGDSDDKSLEEAKKKMNTIKRDKNGNMFIPKDEVESKTEKIFGNEKFGISQEDALDYIRKNDYDMPKFVDYISEKVGGEIADFAAENHTEKFNSQQKAEIRRQTENEIREGMDERLVGYDEKLTEYQKTADDRESEPLVCGIMSGDAQKECDEKSKELTEKTVCEAVDALNGEVSESAKKKSVESCEMEINKKIESEAKKCLISKTKIFLQRIPKYIFTYGNENMTINNFEQYASSDTVFEEFMGITKEEFRHIRDGCTVYDDEKNTIESIGEFFNRPLFNDAIRLFLEFKGKENYLDSSTSQIHNYIPVSEANKTHVSIEMAIEQLDKIDSSSFDSTETCFRDEYMKSGVPMAEAVSRLFNSPVIRKQIPDDEERINYIFENQIFGFASSRANYDYVCEYLLNCMPYRIKKHNIKMEDFGRIAMIEKNREKAREKYMKMLELYDVPVSLENES